MIIQLRLALARAMGLLSNPRSHTEGRGLLTYAWQSTNTVAVVGDERERCLETVDIYHSRLISTLITEASLRPLRFAKQTPIEDMQSGHNLLKQLRS